MPTSLKMHCSSFTNLQTACGLVSHVAVFPGRWVRCCFCLCVSEAVLQLRALCRLTGTSRNRFEADGGLTGTIPSLCAPKRDRDSPGEPMAALSMQLSHYGTHAAAARSCLEADVLCNTAFWWGGGIWEGTRAGRRG